MTKNISKSPAIGRAFSKEKGRHDKSGKTDKSSLANPVEMLKSGQRIDFAGEKSYAESKEEREADTLCKY